MVTPPLSRTHRQRRLNSLLWSHGSTLDSFLTTQRETGATYRQIADKITSLSDGVITVSHETVRAWCRELEEER